MEPYRAMSEIYLYLACTREDEKKWYAQRGLSSKCVLSCKVIMFNGRGEIRKTVNREDRRLIKFIIKIIIIDIETDRKFSALLFNVFNH